MKNCRNLSTGPFLTCSDYVLEISERNAKENN
jgi:hypothetical protein